MSSQEFEFFETIPKHLRPAEEDFSAAIRDAEEGSFDEADAYFERGRFYSKHQLYQRAVQDYRGASERMNFMPNREFAAAIVGHISLYQQLAQQAIDNDGIDRLGVEEGVVFLNPYE